LVLRQHTSKTQRSKLTQEHKILAWTEHHQKVNPQGTTSPTQRLARFLENARQCQARLYRTAMRRWSDCNAVSFRGQGNYGTVRNWGCFVTDDPFSESASSCHALFSVQDSLIQEVTIYISKSRGQQAIILPGS